MLNIGNLGIGHTLVSSVLANGQPAIWREFMKTSLKSGKIALTFEQGAGGCKGYAAKDGRAVRALSGALLKERVTPLLTG
jgi:hypothetical protein